MFRRTNSGAEIWCEEGGRSKDAPTLLLLHGLGANASVWNGLTPILEERWAGRWVAPDLRGHGRSGHAPPYGYAVHAADMAALFAQDEDIVVLGHSMGGVVGMALATGWFGVRAGFVLAFGVKIRWAEGEADKMKELAASPQRRFDTREQAIDRYLKVSGLAGLIAPDAPEAEIGIAEEEGRFRLAADQRSNAAAGPEVSPFYQAARAPVRLAAGSQDPMVSLDDMRPMDPDARLIEGAGHNLHVERPEAIWSHFEELRPT